MDTTEQIREINKLLYELKVADHLVGILLDVKMELTMDIEEWQEFLTYFCEATGKIENLKYIGDNNYPEIDKNEIDVDVEIANFKFFIRRYNQMNDLVKQIEIKSEELSEDMEEDEMFTIWAEEIKQVKDEMGDLHEYINSYDKLDSQI